MSEQCVCLMRNLKFSQRTELKAKVFLMVWKESVNTEADTLGSGVELEAWERENLVSKGLLLSPL